MDIVVTSVDGQRLSAIQVKTRWDKGADGGWHMGKKHETIIEERLFYVFVDLGREPGHKIKSFIVPSKVVARALSMSHARWLSMPGRNGHVRKDSTMRRFLPDYSKIFADGLNPYPAGWLDQYKEAWHLLAKRLDEVGMT